MAEKKQVRKIRHGIRFWMRLVILIVSIVQIVAVEATMVASVRKTVEESMLSRLESDINYVDDLVGRGEWHIHDGALYCGEKKIGDGDPAHAYPIPFLELQEKTGTFSYVFIRCPDEGLAWIGDEKNGYQQGHYMRVSGITIDDEGDTLMGTHIEKEVADALDTQGYYAGRANAVGTEVFCLYYSLSDNQGNIVGAIVVARSVEELNARTWENAQMLFWIIFLSVLLADIVLNIILSRWLEKLDIANKYLIDISSGDFPEKPLDLQSTDELSITADCINDMTATLKEKVRLSGEMAAGADIQANMLPHSFPDRDEFDISAVMHPAREVCGDFYDVFMIDDDRLCFVMADVSGKGVPAALIMAISKMLIKNHAKTGMDPKNVFTEVNRILCEGNETNVFVTAFLGVLELTTGKFTYTNAGHNPPLIRFGNGSFKYLRSPAGMLLGVFDSVRYTQHELILAPGDRFFLYTDGVTESMNAENKLYGNERLQEFLSAHTQLSAAEMLQGLKADIDAFAGECEQFDDITMLMLDYFKPFIPLILQEKEFPADKEALEDMIAFIRETLRNKPIPRKVLTQILTAADEIFTNIASYAYPEGGGAMRLGISADETAVKLRFTDEGIAFDPLKATEPNTQTPVSQRKIGGLGIFLVRKAMDKVTYSREDGCNILTLKKIYRD